MISSAPAVGTVKHGLTAEGRLQARQSATKLLDLVGRENLGSLAFGSILGTSGTVWLGLG